MDDAEHVRRWRLRAEEQRRSAAQAADDAARAGFLRSARLYEQMAEQVEQEIASRRRD